MNILLGLQKCTLVLEIDIFLTFLMLKMIYLKFLASEKAVSGQKYKIFVSKKITFSYMTLILVKMLELGNKCLIIVFDNSLFD